MECLKPLCLVEVSMMFIQVHTDTLKISNILLVETASVEFSLHLGVGKAFGYFYTFPNSQRQCFTLHSLHANTGFWGLCWQFSHFLRLSNAHGISLTIVIPGNRSSRFSKKDFNHWEKHNWLANGKQRVGLFLRVFGYFPYYGLVSALFIYPIRDTPFLVTSVNLCCPPVP